MSKSQKKSAASSSPSAAKDHSSPPKKPAKKQHATPPNGGKAIPSGASSPRGNEKASTNGSASKKRSAAPAKSGSLHTRFLIVLQMIVCVAGIYLCFGMWSVKQERIVTKPYFRSGEAEGAMIPTVFGFGLVQATAGFLFGALLVLLQRVFVGGSSAPQPARTPRHTTSDGGKTNSVLRPLLLVGFTNAFAASLGYAAMRRLPFPVVLATKMSKMFPVMVVGFISYGARYSAAKLTSCAMITIGAIVFYLLEEAAHPHGTPAKPTTPTNAKNGQLGFLLLFVNLIMDGFTNSTQDELVRRLQWGGNQLMMYTNFATMMWIVVALGLLDVVDASMLSPVVTPLAAWLGMPAEKMLSWVAFGDFSITCSFLQEYPEAAYDLLSMSALNALGQFFIFRTISLFGTVTLTTMTLVRKAGSVVLSIILHGHRVNSTQMAALSAVFVGVGWESWLNVKETEKKRAARG